MTSPLRKKNVATIPLSIRGKKRYILFRVILEKEGGSFPLVSKESFSRALDGHLLHCFGVLGLPLHRVRLMVYNPVNHKGIVRCAHTSKDALITALLSFRSLNGKKILIRTHATSGTLLSLKDDFYRSEER